MSVSVHLENKVQLLSCRWVFACCRPFLPHVLYRCSQAAINISENSAMGLVLSPSPSNYRHVRGKEETWNNVCGFTHNFSSLYISCGIRFPFHWWELGVKEFVMWVEILFSSGPLWSSLWDLLAPCCRLCSPFLISYLLIPFLPMLCWATGIPILRSFSPTAIRGIILSNFQLQVHGDAMENVFWGVRPALSS